MPQDAQIQGSAALGVDTDDCADVPTRCGFWPFAPGPTTIGPSTVAIFDIGALTMIGTIGVIVPVHPLSTSKVSRGHRDLGSPPLLLRSRLLQPSAVLRPVSVLAR